MIQGFDKLYVASRQVMHAILHSQSSNDLFNAVSKIMVEYGGFAMAVVAWHDSGSQELVPVAQFGDTTGYLDRIRMFADERPEGLGAAGTAFREGKVSIVNDFLNDPRTSIWSGEARAAGWGSSAAIPIRVAGVVRGVLGVYAVPAGFFGSNEREILEQVALDMGFALQNFEKENLRRQLEASLAASELRLQLAIEAGQIGIFDWDLHTSRIVWDGHTERLFGFEPGEFDGTYASFESRLHPDDTDVVNRAVVVSRETRTPLVCDFRAVWPDRSVHWLSSRGEYSYDDSGQAIRMLGAVSDITARKHAEEARKTSDKRLRESLDGLLEGCMLIDFNWMYLYVNETAARHGLQSRESLIGCTMQDVYTGIEATEVFARYRLCMRDRAPQHFESAFTFASGVERWYEFSVSPAPEGIFVLSLDITERKQTEAAFRESEERLRQALRAARIGIFDRDLRKGTTYLSPLQLVIHGYSPDEQVELRSFLERVHPQDRQWLREAAARSHEPSGDGSFDAEYRLLLPDGTVRWVRSLAQTFFEGEGAERCAVRTVGATTDITKEKLAQDEQTRLAAMVARNRDFIGIATLDGQVSYLNPAALAMVGIGTIEEAREKRIEDFVFNPQGLREMLAIVGAEGDCIRETQLRHFAGGSPIDVEVTAFIIRDDRGRPLSIATVTRDLRERRKAEAERSKLEAQLAQAAKMESIGRLAGGIAHDFNNMLTVILGYAAMGRSAKDLDATHRKHLAEIEKAANRSKEITRQLLGFSRKQIIAPVPSDLNALVWDLLPPLTRLIGENIDLRFRPLQELWRVEMDHSQVNQILLNLVVNARDAMPVGGKLTIETMNANVSEDYSRMHPCSVPGQYAVLAVSDSGVGMDSGTIAHIFEPFFSTKDRDQNTGLGLATVFGIVKQNGGFVNVYSEIAHGATFRIYLPRMPAEAASPEAVAHAGRMPAGSGTILLVEDNDLVREMTTIGLESLGYTPLVAKDAKQAIELCSRTPSEIRLMLTDVVMPGMNGIELRDRVMAINPRIRVLFMSGYTSNVIVNHGVLKEGVNFIQKPFNIDDLGRRLVEVLTADNP